jgi:hypothetical protein
MKHSIALIMPLMLGALRAVRIADRTPAPACAAAARCARTVAGLFHAPGSQPWRLAFAAGDAVRSGITVGLLGCSMSAGSGAQPTPGKEKP